MLKVYPAIFLKEDIGYSVSFPDLDGCFTEGNTLEEGIEMAQEALGLYLVSLEERNINIPLPSDISAIEYSGNEFVTLVSTPIQKYRRRNKAIKKTLTIPQWLNEEAELRHINFSSVLQKALKEELQVAESYNTNNG